ncbi:MAG: hypothetical protein ACRDNT_07060 [Streptosporangiaceae bacterium]
MLAGHSGEAAAVARDGTWLASGGSGGTVRIEDTVAWQLHALMRVEDTVSACAWSALTRLRSAAAEQGRTSSASIIAQFAEGIRFESRVTQPSRHGGGPIQAFDR